MFGFTNSLNQNVQGQNSTREAVTRTHEDKLDILVLEERIAPVRLSYDGIDGEAQDMDHKVWSG